MKQEPAVRRVRAGRPPDVDETAGLPIQFWEPNPPPPKPRKHLGFFVFVAVCVLALLAAAAMSINFHT